MFDHFKQLKRYCSIGSIIVTPSMIILVGPFNDMQIIMYDGSIDTRINIKKPIGSNPVENSILFAVNCAFGDIIPVAITVLIIPWQSTIQLFLQ